MSPSDQLVSVAVRWDDPQLDLLAPPARALYESVEASVRNQWDEATPSERRRFDRVGGCLAKLNSTLLQVLRLRRFHDHIVSQAKEVPENGFAALKGEEACADFESLLLHGRAALDRLAWLISTELNQQTSSYRRLQNVMDNFPNDERAKLAVRTLDAAKPWLDKVFAKLDSEVSLRDTVGHNQAILEGMVSCYGIWRLADDRALIMDCEVVFPGHDHAIGLLNTAAESAQHIPFVVLNLLAAFSELELVDLPSCTSLWTCEAVPVTAFLAEEPEGTPLRDDAIMFGRRMLPKGYRVSGWRNVRPELFDLAVTIPPVP